MHVRSHFLGTPEGRDYLDATAGPCKGNIQCVSASVSPDRDQGSGTWQVSLAGAQSIAGGMLESGVQVHLQNMHRGPEGEQGQGYLDTREPGCEGNMNCVSASSSKDRDMGSGTWELIRVAGPGPINYGDEVYIRNKYRGKLGGAYMDVRKGDCDGNRHCVSAASSRNRSTKSGTWTFVPAFV